MEVINMDDKELDYQKLKNSIIDLTNQNNYLLNELNIIKHTIIKKNIFSFENENYCPICGNFSVFGSGGLNNRANVQCPNCGSLERHRLVYLFLQKNYSYLLKDFLLENNSIKFLHFAPEIIFFKLFSKNKNIDYFPVDIDPEGYENSIIKIKQKVDMQNIPYADNMFDFIYNSHVLEHVPNDIKGMSELYRVLKDDGVCFTLIPQFNLETTLEKDEYNTPELRLKYYGQEDHWRRYGLDFKDRLESVGFNVDEIVADDLVKTKEEKELYNLKFGNDILYICTK